MQRCPLPPEIMLLRYKAAGRFVGLKPFKRLVHFTTFSGLLKETGLCSCCSEPWNMLQDFHHLLNDFTHSRLCFSFRPRDWESSVPLSYVTEDLRGCSFRLSAGGGPQHLARVDGGGGLGWSPQIMRTMEQMTADKLQRVGWPEKSVGGWDKPDDVATPLLPLLLEGGLEMAHELSWL